ncbi:MAG TPA: NADH-quinone oxidoreductase subunit C [Acidimicrobiales bacterium]|nr:NADH-quinone oxidoreductase subunit C [Acidimicrobiales bacterium]
MTGAGAPLAAPLEAHPALADVPRAVVRGRVVWHPGRDRYLETVVALRDLSFVTCSDLCGVDYLHHPGRDLPRGVSPERFEVAVHLLSIERVERVGIRVQVPESDPVLPTIVPVFPGAEAMEREAFDMFGLRFEGHPDMTRILMPEDWEGHPLRKDYSPGRVPVQFKEAPGPR